MVDVLEATLDAVVDGVLLVDPAGRIVEANRAAAVLFGYSREEILGRQLESLVPELVGTSLTAGPQGAGLAAGSRSEILAHRKDGAAIPLEIAVGQGNEHGRSFFVALLHDLSDRRLHERRAHERRERLATALLVSTLGEAASTITHEINQPLAAIANYAQAGRRIVEKDPSRTDRVLEILEKIGAQAQRAGDDLRRFRRLVDRRQPEEEAVASERLDLNELLRETVELTQLETASAPPPIELELQPDLPSTRGHRVQLQAVLLSLLRSGLAARSAGDATPLVVRTRSIDEGTLELTMTTVGEAPIPQEEGSLSSPFFTTRESSLGMGMAVSASIVAAHGGELMLERDESGRTTFRCRLPVSTED